ncbi:MAG: hypothetical protein HXX13_15390 [Bacteroidetes bacterium]|nr:hypothetical protein [Bacteroidota bacterium]
MKLVKSGFCTVVFVFSLLSLFAQDRKLLLDKPGSFKITVDKLNGLGPDEYGRTCDFTDAECKVAVKNLTALLSVFRKTAVLTENKGFDGINYLNAGNCNTKFGYGLPCTVYILFETWSLIKGKIVKQTVEPPQFRFEVNRTTVFNKNGFEETNYSNAYNPTNPAYNEKGMNEATVAINELFYMPGVKEEVVPGIDRYGNNLVIYNPDRPAYWDQVTIREVFRLLFDYWKRVPDKATMEPMMEVFEAEYATYSESERDSFAYFGSPESISRIGSAKNNTPVMRSNPDYWNKKLPRSDIQFMVLEIPPQKTLENEVKTLLEKQDGGYYVSRMLYELDIDNLRHEIAH